MDLICLVGAYTLFMNCHDDETEKRIFYSLELREDMLDAYILSVQYDEDISSLDVFKIQPLGLSMNRLGIAVTFESVLFFARSKLWRRYEGEFQRKSHIAISNEGHKNLLQ